MNKSTVAILGTILLLILGVWLLGGPRVSCRESFWDRDTQIIEIKRGE